MDLACVDHPHGAAEICVMPFSLVTVDFDVHPRSQGTQNRPVRANPDVRGWIKDDSEFASVTDPGQHVGDRG